MKISVERTLNKAKLALKRGDVFQARQLYSQVLAAYPGNSRAQAAMSNLNRLLDTAARSTADSPQAQLKSLMSLLNQGRYAEVIEQGEELSRSQSHGHIVCNILGAANSSLGRNARAIECFETALQLKPDYADAHTNLGQVLMESDQPARAADCFRNALKLKPDNAHLQKNLGIALQFAGMTDEAIDSFCNAVRVQPADTELQLKLATLLNENDRLEEAADRFVKLLETSPEAADLHNNLGNLTLRLYGFDQAIGWFRKALSLEPSHWQALLNLCVCCVHSGKSREAAELLNQLQLLRPGATSVVRLLLKLPADAISQDLMAALDNCHQQDNQSQLEFETERTFLHAELLDRDGMYQEAWQHMAKANAMAYPEHAGPFESQAAGWITDEEKIRECNIDVSDPTPEPAEQNRIIPLFVLGASRAGKTTLEALVASEPTVARGYENAAVEASAIRVSLAAGLGAVPSIADLPATLLGAFADDFRVRLQTTYEQGNVVTITNPGHISNVCDLAKALPEARFVFVTRDRDDNALRMFMNTYNEGNHHAYDIDSVYRYLGWYETATDLLVSKLGDRCLHLKYEDITSAPDSCANRVRELCGLEPRAEELPALGSDVGAATPYRDFIAQAKR